MTTQNLTFIDLQTLIKNVKESVKNNNTTELDNISQYIKNCFDNNKYYEFFNVDKQLPTDELAKQLTLLMRPVALNFHPDRYPQDELKQWASNNFAFISTMKDVLSDDTSRQEFDNNSSTFDVNMRNWTVDEILEEQREAELKELAKQKFGFNIKDYQFSNDKDIQEIEKDLTIRQTVNVSLKQFLTEETFDISYSMQGLSHFEDCLDCGSNGCPKCQFKGKIFVQGKTINKQFKLLVNEKYQQGTTIKLDGMGNTHNGITGDALLTLNFVDEYIIEPNQNNILIRLQDNKIVIYYKPSIKNIIDETFSMKLFNKEYQINILDNNVIIDTIKSKPVMLMIEPITIHIEPNDFHHLKFLVDHNDKNQFINYLSKWEV